MHKTSTGFVFKRAKIFSTFFIDSRTKTPLDEEKVSCYAIWERSTSNLVVSLNSFLTWQEQYVYNFPPFYFFFFWKMKSRPSLEDVRANPSDRFTSPGLSDSLFRAVVNSVRQTFFNKRLARSTDVSDPMAWSSIQWHDVYSSIEWSTIQWHEVRFNNTNVVFWQNDVLQWHGVRSNDMKYMIR